MEIKAKVALSLPNKFYKVTLKYDTFEKATYDSYLIASLVKNTKNKKEAEMYIDDISGEGSLNPHFKKLYNDISKLTDEQIDGILKDSLFPITVIDDKHHFEYYEMFDATKMNNKVYHHNLADDPNLKDMIMPKDQNAKFLSVDFKLEDGTVVSNVYDAIFTENEIKVDLAGGNYCPISKENFDSVYANDLKEVERYKGIIGNQITSGNWNVLNNQSLAALCNLKQFYIDNDGNHCTVLLNCMKKTEVINVFSLYFYKETRYEYTIKNSNICEQVVDYLIMSNNINEFKTRNLINILAAVSDITAQNVVLYILRRKESKEIAEVGLRLIKQGLEKGWDSEVLKSIKKFCPKSEIKYIYKLDNNLNFDLEDDILFIDDVDLTEIDLKRKREYVSERKNRIKSMNSMVGDIMNSGIREKMKSLKTQDSDCKDLRKFINKYSAHNRNDYEKMSLEKLTNVYNEIDKIYKGPFETIKARLTKQEEIA